MLSSVNNALRVLEFVVEEGGSGVSEVSRGLDLTIGTTYRLIATLVGSGYLEQNDDNRRYRPGQKIPQLARLMRADTTFVKAARPHLEALSEVAQETVNLAVLRKGDVVYIDRAVTNQPLAVTVRVGSHVPAYCTSLGRALLAFAPPEKLAAYIEHLQVHGSGHAQATPTSDELVVIVEHVRELGYAEEAGEFAPDIACIAAPVLDSRGHAAAAVSISMPASRFHARKDDLVTELKLAAMQLTDLLQFHGDGTEG
ncbi:MAG: DNA-binding IclR family transcriptional regulator [Glaciecola sp.]|jgi:DNA-binding IclR family transcriptional regulator